LPTTHIALYNCQMSATVDRSAPGLKRDLELLEALGSDAAQAAGGLGVSRLAEMVGRDKGQVSRALRVLESEGLVERDSATREFRIGWRIFALAALNARTHLLQVAPAFIDRLAAELNEAVHLCVPQGRAVLTVLSKVPADSQRLGWEGRLVPATRTSAGRVLWMDATLADLTERFEPSDFVGSGPRHRVKNASELYEEISSSRERGYALVDEEFEVDLVGASAAVRDFRGQVVAAVNVSASKARLGPRLIEAGEAVARTAAEITLKLGGGASSWGSPVTVGWHKPS